MKDFFLCFAVILIFPFRFAFFPFALIWEISGELLAYTGKYNRILFIADKTENLRDFTPSEIVQIKEAAAAIRTRQ